MLLQRFIVLKIALRNKVSNLPSNNKCNTKVDLRVIAMARERWLLKTTIKICCFYSLSIIFSCQYFCYLLLSLFLFSKVVYHNAKLMTCVIALGTYFLYTLS